MCARLGRSAKECYDTGLREVESQDEEYEPRHRGSIEFAEF